MTLDLIPLQFGFGVPGGMELAVILLIAILLFGANKIPKLARSTGQALGEFQRGREEINQELQELQEGPGTSDAPEDSTSEDAPSTDGGSADGAASADSTTEESSDDTDESK